MHYSNFKMIHENQPSPEILSGVVERITFHNPDNGYSVLKVKVTGRGQLVTVVGHLATIKLGEALQASGEWLNDPAYGLQFKSSSLTISPPTTLEGVQKYLSSGMIKGIGPVYAKKLVRAFGEAVFDVIEKTPQKLFTVPGIGQMRAKQIIQGWSEQKVMRDIMIFLHQHNISSSRAVRIYKTFGADAIKVILENPYKLVDQIRGIGFISADAIAQKVGIEKTSLTRAEAGLHYVLSQAMEQGHCGLPQENFFSQAEDILEVPRDLLEQALAQSCLKGQIIIDKLEGVESVFSKNLYQAEQAIAAFLKLIHQTEIPWKISNVKEALKVAEKMLGVKLAESQTLAVCKVLESKISVITGGPGVGKTTLIKTLITILAAQNLKIVLCAPTGRAAKRLAETTGLEAKTIHRLLEMDPIRGDFKRSADYPLTCDLLIIDEMSMVDVPLMYALMKAVPSKAAVIFVGDIDQLPSVGPGSVLADIIASNAFNVVRLTEVFRQMEASQIIVNAHRINQGLMPLEPPSAEISDFYFIESKDPADGVNKIIQLVKKRIPERFHLNPLKDIQVLCPMNKGGLGTRSLNIELQKALLQTQEGGIERFGSKFSPGDKVMQIVNNYDKDVYNGDIGFIEEMDLDQSLMLINFDGRGVGYDFSELDQITLAYATTIHKSQGSEYPAVVIPIVTQHYMMLKRNLLYTAVTRGKKLVVLVGQRQALKMAIESSGISQRGSKLKDWLYDKTIQHL
jgi:exodeoxyribonuclease V alpha subunit